MVWERFDAQGARVREPSIGIQVTGTFSINLAAWEMMGKPERVFLYFDRGEARRRIGFQPARKDHPSAYSVRTSNGPENTRFVSGSAFLGYYRCKPKKAMRFGIRQDVENNMFYIELPSEAQGTFREEEGNGRLASRASLPSATDTRYCARGERCIGYDPDDLDPKPNRLRSDNSGNMCSRCKKLVGAA